MSELYSREELLLDKADVEKLKNACVMIVGIGGVGAYAAEMIARAGVKKIVLLDADTVKGSNLNRQLIALNSTLEKPKVEVMQARILDINPEAEVMALNTFLENDNIEAIFAKTMPDFVIDAIDTVGSKMALIKYCYENKIGLISSMGAGARIDPTMVQYGDISKTENCALARVVRQRLRQEGIKKGVMTVFSKEPAIKESVIKVEDEKGKLSTTGTISYLPATFGIYLGAYAIRFITNRL